MLTCTPENKALGVQFAELFSPVYHELSLLPKNMEYIISDDIYYSSSSCMIYTSTMIISVERWGLDVLYQFPDKKQVYLYEDCNAFQLCDPDTYDEALRILDYVRMVIQLIKYRSTIRIGDESECVL